MSASGDEPLDCPGQYVDFNLDEDYVEIRLEGDYCKTEFLEWESAPETLDELGWTDHIQNTGYLEPENEGDK